MKKENLVAFLRLTKTENIDMVLALTWLRPVTTSASLTWICVIMWTFCLLPGLECQRGVFNTDESYNDYYNDLSDEEREQPTYFHRASLNEGTYANAMTRGVYFLVHRLIIYYYRLYTNMTSIILPADLVNRNL